MRRRAAVLAVAALVLAAAFTSCDDMIIQVFGFSRLSGTDHLEGEGLVIYIRIEGGFYGIVAGPNGQWDPINLPAEYMKDGLKVKFEGKIRKDLSSPHMWGAMVELTSIHRI